MVKVGVWGAGAIGTGTVYRLAVSPFISEIHWINRSTQKIRYRVVDIEHGLAFAPTCRTIRWYPQERAERALPQIDLLIVTLGTSVPQGANRADLYQVNRDTFRETLIPSIRGFVGIVLVVTNPVDLLARLVYIEAGIPKTRILGLGTVVETARLRTSLGSYRSPHRPAREVWAYAVGTHDEHFVVVAPGTIGMSVNLEKAVLNRALTEVVHSTRRVKSDDRSTLHPVVEGIVTVAESIARDAHSILTVSVADPTTPESLFYSVPCTLGRQGLVHRHTEAIGDPSVEEKLTTCKQALIHTLQNTTSDF